jgi:hypothetical protein
MTIGSSLLATATSQLDGPGEMEHAMLLFSSAADVPKGVAMVPALRLSTVSQSSLRGAI